MTIDGLIDALQALRAASSLGGQTEVFVRLKDGPAEILDPWLDRSDEDMEGEIRPIVVFENADTLDEEQDDANWAADL